MVLLAEALPDEHPAPAGCSRFADRRISPLPKWVTKCCRSTGQQYDGQRRFLSYRRTGEALGTRLYAGLCGYPAALLRSKNRAILGRN
jgi:hypothetical protein